MKRQVHERLFLSILFITIVCVSFQEPESLSFVLLKIGGLPAMACMLTLLGFCVIALVDTFVNDILPHTFCFRIGIRYRQIIWLMIGITFAGLAFVVVKHRVGYWVAAVYSLYALRCTAIAFLDLWYGYQDQLARTQKRRETDHPQLYGALS